MHFREAIPADIPQLQVVRHLVKENILSDPALVTDEDCNNYLTNRGKGWVCEVENKIVGFAIADLSDHSVWALFIHPEFQNKGIGKTLHQMMMNWYFSQTRKTVWLSTAAGTRAEKFYLLQGWRQTGILKNGELKFEMEFADWICH
ncbi:MAG TPA: GNAT family N-acetyltransferase [Flavisolibacter sp.]|nr:GNAT family N-acetyltransferase [Flavisolibacter sp.]